MIRPQFSAFLDIDGNVHIAPGCLVDPSQTPTAQYWINGPAQVGLPDNSDSGLRRVASKGGTVFMGGNGRNVIVTGTVSGLVVGTGSGAYTVRPTGIYVQSGAEEWQTDFMVMTFDSGLGTAEISDGTDVVATMATSASPDAPDGTFSSTTYGETTYNGGTPFTLTAAFEDRIIWVGATVSSGFTTTIETGNYTGTAWGQWEADTDPNWTITTDVSGSAEISDGTDIVAERATGRDGDPTGIYESTTYGAATYSSLESFTVDVRRLPVPAPITGVWYCTVETSGGSGHGPGGGHTFVDFTGPFFAATMPANSSTETHFTIAESNGSTIWQILEGPIQWHS